MTDNERIAQAVGFKPGRGVDGGLVVYARLEGDALEHWHPCDFTTDWDACERWLVPWLADRAVIECSRKLGRWEVFMFGEMQVDCTPETWVGEAPTLAAAFCAAFIKYLDSQEAKT